MTIPSGAGSQDISPDPGILYTFQDEFDGPDGSAPAAHWVYDSVPGPGELEVYTESRNNSYLDGLGNLVIAATTDGEGHYWSARLCTNGTFAQQGGHFEMRIKLNSQAGAWPAAWMLGTDFNTQGWPRCGEVDILEDYGRSSIESTVHTPNGRTTYMQQGGVPSDTDWHAYRLDWDLGARTFTFNRDGWPYLTVSANQFPAASWVFGPGGPNNGGMFFLLNVAVGGYVGTPPAATEFPVSMLVDYVRAWQ
jgi:beta-glucanase (GH16 family)